MPVFANVHGKIRELYRVFFNDNGVIREIESLHAQNDNNEIKELFVRNLNPPEVISWVAYIDKDDGSNDGSTVNSVTNNGYTINGSFTVKKRSIATKDKIFLASGTQIRVEISNTVYHTGVVIFDSVNIFLFSTESTSLEKQASRSYESSKSNTMTVMNTGDYYIALSIYGKDAKNVVHHCTTDVNVSILPP